MACGQDPNTRWRREVLAVYRAGVADSNRLKINYLRFFVGRCPMFQLSVAQPVLARASVLQPGREIRSETFRAKPETAHLSCRTDAM